MREIDKEKEIQKCCNCNEWKDLNLFPKNKRMKFGIDTTCKECTNKRAKKHFQENREYKKEYLKEYYSSNKEELKKKQKKYYLDNFETKRKYWKEHHKKNRDKRLKYYKEWYKTPSGQASHAKSRAKRRGRIKEFDTDITAEFLTNLWEETQTCEICEKELTNKKNAHLDHIIPLNIGGEHMSYNVRYICASCNVSRPKDGSDLK